MQFLGVLVRFAMVCRYDLDQVKSCKGIICRSQIYLSPTLSDAVFNRISIAGA